MDVKTRSDAYRIRAQRITAGSIGSRAESIQGKFKKYDISSDIQVGETPARKELRKRSKMFGNKNGMVILEKKASKQKSDLAESPFILLGVLEGCFECLLCRHLARAGQEQLIVLTDVVDTRKRAARKCEDLKYMFDEIKVILSEVA